MKVAIVMFDGVQALDVAGPLDVFAEANTHSRPSISDMKSRSSDTKRACVTCSNGMQSSFPLAIATSTRHSTCCWWPADRSCPMPPPPRVL